MLVHALLVYISSNFPTKAHRLAYSCTLLHVDLQADYRSLLVATAMV